MSAATQTLNTVESITQSGYKWGFETDIEMDLAPKGLNEDIIRLISSRKEEPAWLLEWRLKAFAAWQQMTEPHWARVEHNPIDYQDLHYYAAPKKKSGPKSLDEVDPELLKTYEKLGIPLKERAILAGDDAGDDAKPGGGRRADKNGKLRLQAEAFRGIGPDIARPAEIATHGRTRPGRRSRSAG